MKRVDPSPDLRGVHWIQVIIDVFHSWDPMEAFVSVNILRFHIFGPKHNEILGSISQGRFFEVPPQNCRSVLAVNAFVLFARFFYILLETRR